MVVCESVCLLMRCSKCFNCKYSGHVRPPGGGEEIRDFLDFFLRGFGPEYLQLEIGRTIYYLGERALSGQSLKKFQFCMFSGAMAMVCLPLFCC